MISLDKVSKKMGARTLFENVTTSFSAKRRYGLTGPNGAGKSTLMKMMVGEEECTSGVVRLPKRVGFLKQDIEPFRNFSLMDTVIMGNDPLWSALEKRDRLYEEEMTDAIGMELAHLEEQIADEGGYTAESEAAILLEGMGIPSSTHDSLMHSVPSDWQFRVLLCQALFGDPEALLLDEPTNHLDLASIQWLEEFLREYQGTLIVISHDRHFLNTITTYIADIDYDTVIIYPGNYDDMLLAKVSTHKGVEEANKSKEKKIAQLQEFVSKFSAGTRASQVQSRLREIERLKPEEMKQSNIQRPYIRFAPITTQSGQMVLSAKRLHKAYEEETIIKNFSYEVPRGKKIGIIGNNGMGKTTLLKMLAQQLTPDQGELSHGHNVSVGYFPQDHSEAMDKGRKITAFEWLKEQKPGVYDQEIRGILGKLLFAGDDAFKLIEHLSGGETGRLILGSLLLTNPNTLFLDEPNNHLDLESVSALASGLKDYKGTIVMVAHDRDLIGSVADAIIAFEENGIEKFDGPLEEYLSYKKAQG